MKKLTTFVFLAAFLFSCSPFTKEAYMEKFKVFMDEVSSDYRQYDDKQWAKADKKYEKFNKQWYDRFKDEFSARERFTITGYKVRYNSFKGIRIINSNFQELFKTNIGQLREQISFYLENNLMDDLDLSLQEVRKISEEAYLEARRILDELQKE